MAYIGNSPANVGNYQVVDNITTFNGTLTSFERKIKLMEK